MKESNRAIKIILSVTFVVLIALAIALMLKTKPNNEIAILGSQKSVQKLVQNKGVQALYVEGDKVYIFLTDEEADKRKLKPFKGTDRDYRKKDKAHYSAKITSPSYFNDLHNKLIEGLDRDKEHPRVFFENIASKQRWTSLIVPSIGFVLLLLFFYFIYKQSAGIGTSIGDFSKSKARLSSNVKVRFSDVAGAEEEKEELKEIVDFLKTPKKFEELGAKIPKGVLLVGPPGTGKTLFAKAIAGEANVPFFFISGSDFVEMFVGTGAARVRDLFNQAKKNMPCIVFIDEIDAAGRLRGAGLGGGNDEKEQTLNQLLVEMDGFEKEDKIIILAATNRADILDPALLRPGRFDRHIYIGIPDVKAREEILKVHARNKPLAPSVSFKLIARMTVGFTGADLENLLNEAAIFAARDDRKQIENVDILEAINKVIAGPKKKSRVVTHADKRITAYHESGHAIVAKLLPYCDEVQEVSIIPRGMAAGYTLTRPETDDSHVSKNKLLDSITMLLAGRAAEEIVIQDISTGASNDIERATSIAKKMVTEWGMSPTFGNVCLSGDQEVFLGRDYAMHNTISDKTAYQIDQEIQSIIKKAYARAVKILEENLTILNNMVTVLFERDTIYTNEVDMLFDNKSPEEVIKYIDEKIELLGADASRLDILEDK